MTIVADERVASPSTGKSPRRLALAARLTALISRIIAGGSGETVAERCEISSPPHLLRRVPAFVGVELRQASRSARLLELASPQ